MKKVKTVIVGVLFVSIAVTELMACTPNQKKYEEQAIHVLEEKYEDEFEVMKYLGHQSMSEHYEIMAFSRNYPDILFEASVACDGSYVNDEYVASRVCRTIEEKMEKNMGGLKGYMQVKVQAISKSIDSAEADMSIQEFMSMKTKNRFVVYLTYSPVENDIHNLYQNLKGAFSDLECMNGSIKLYITNEKILKQVQQYLTENAKVDYEFDVKLEHTKPVTIPFENGVIHLSEKELERKAGEIM